MILKTFSLAIRNLMAHGFRSFLTSLGIIFGIVSIIVMMSIGEGARIKSMKAIKAMGINNIIVKSVRPADGVGTPGGVYEYGLNEIDFEHFNGFSNIKSVTPARHIRKPIYYGSTSFNLTGLAITQDFQNLLNLKIISGRKINEGDNSNNSRVCLLGKKTKRTIFKFNNPIGKFIRIGLIPYQVIGILENPNGVKTPFGKDPEEMIFVPINSFKSDFSFRGIDPSINQTVDISYDMLFLKVKNLNTINYSADRAKRFLKKTHKNTDFEISVPYQLLKQKEETQRTFSIVMVAIAAISLLVGGIGITNIMTANVFERYKEIGIRRALGARKIDILFQFLVEAVTITLAGGIFGVAFGIGGAFLITSIVDWPTAITPESVIGSFLISAFIGILFGTYPAWLAAKLDPIKALRSE